MPKMLFVGGAFLPCAVILGLLFSLIILPFVRTAALFSGIVDIPRDERRMHTRAVPLAGGAGIIASFFLTAFFLAGGEKMPALALLCTASLAYGLCDDILAMKASHKLALQVLLACVSCAFTGSAETLRVLGREYSLGALSVPFTVLWTVFMMNAVNLTDGMDGLASGVCSVSAAALSLILYFRGEYAYAVCSAALCGACLGFLFYNGYPARIFMGETGSAFIGFMLAMLTVPCFSGGEAVKLSEISLVFFLPLSEAVCSFVRRAVKGKNPFSPDTGHMHHVLLRKGFSVRSADILLYVFSFVCAFFAVVYGKNAYAALSALTLAFALRARLTSTSGRRL